MEKTLRAWTPGQIPALIRRPVQDFLKKNLPQNSKPNPYTPLVDSVAHDLFKLESTERIIIPKVCLTPILGSRKVQIMRARAPMARISLPPSMPRTVAATMASYVSAVDESLHTYSSYGFEKVDRPDAGGAASFRSPAAEAALTAVEPWGYH